MEDMIPNIAITGGPGAGKTTILSGSADRLMSYGYTPLVCPEAATIIIGGNIKHPNPYLQKSIFATQMHLYETFNSAAKFVQKPVILHDRGVMDNLAYMNGKDFRELIKPYELEHLRDSQFKAVIHLQTAAIDAEKFYTLENNQARTETPERARELDGLLLNAWNGHPKHITIVNKGITFEEKKKMAIDAILGVLGIPIPIEDEVKYLISPSFTLAMIPKDVYVVTTPIVQTYLASSPGVSERVRKRGINGCEIYFHTIKRPIYGTSARIEEEKMISFTEYQQLLRRKDPASIPIYKDRYTFHCDGMYLELDVFKGGIWAGLILLEIEKTIAGSSISLPEFMKPYIERDVSDEVKYKNEYLAKNRS